MKKSLYYILTLNFSLLITTSWAQEPTVTSPPDLNHYSIIDEIQSSPTDNTSWVTLKTESDAPETVKLFHENGNLYIQATLKENLIHGSYQIWYANGQLAESIQFKDNLEDGRAEFYHSNGQLAMEGNFRQGEMTGEWKFFDKDGNPPTGIWEWKFAVSNEITRIKGQLIYGKPSGTWSNWTTSNQDGLNQKKFTKDYNLNMFLN